MQNFHPYNLFSMAFLLIFVYISEIFIKNNRSNTVKFDAIGRRSDHTLKLSWYVVDPFSYVGPQYEYEIEMQIKCRTVS